MFKVSFHLIEPVPSIFSHSPHHDWHPLIGLLSLEYLLLPRFLTVTVENHQMPFVGATAIHVFPRLLETFFNSATLQPVDDLQFQHHPPQEKGIADEVAAPATLRQAQGGRRGSMMSRPSHSRPWPVTQREVYWNPLYALPCTSPCNRLSRKARKRSTSAW